MLLQVLGKDSWELFGVGSEPHKSLLFDKKYHSSLKIKITLSICQ